MLLERRCLWLARTNAWIVAPEGPGGDCVLVDVPPEPDDLLARLAELELGPVAILATHGHVDHVGGMSTVAGSIGRTDLPGGSFESLMASMAEHILPLPDDLAVLPGHGAPTTIGRERATNPFLVDLQRALAATGDGAAGQRVEP